MSADEKLLAVQNRLQEAGVLDVKFYFQPGVGKFSPSQVKEEVAEVLGCLFDGAYRQVDSIQESVLA